MCEGVIGGRGGEDDEAKAGQSGWRPGGRSAGQRQASADFTEVVKGWEELSDAERLAWGTASSRVMSKGRKGKRRPLKGYNYFVKINARRLRAGRALTRMPPRAAPTSPQLAPQLVIRNRNGRISLQLKVSHVPGVRVLVCGSPPCSRGRSRWRKWFPRWGRCRRRWKE